MMKTRDPKKVFSKADVPKVAPKPDDRVTEIRRYKLITPLFGGGVEPQEADPITTIRGASVRGQVRFWWRATRGGQFDGSLETMRKAEQAIWGSAAKKDDKNSGPSEVKISIRHSTEGTQDRPFEVVPGKSNKPRIQARSGSSVPPYAAFPLQPERDKAEIGMETLPVKTGVEFALEISYPKNLEKDVQAALWAWETFGGIGARTRRGFGALQLVAHWINGEKKAVALPSIQQSEAQIRKQLETYGAKGKWPQNVPHLPYQARMVIIHLPDSPIGVWKNLITHYQNFRQKRFKKYGMSRWPEANEIRHRWQRRHKWPKDVDGNKMGSARKFPRAAFGLPVVFHLPHDDGWEQTNFTLQGKTVSKNDHRYERMASPLILKPYPCENNQAIGLAAVLQGIHMPPHGLEIIEAREGEQISTQSVDWQELTANEATSEPLDKVLHGQTDVIGVFLQELNQLNKKESR